MKISFTQIKWLIFVVLFFVITYSPTQTMAYSIETHRAINEKNTNKESFLHRYLINHLGFKDGVETKIKNKWIIKHVADGGEYEDLGFRSLNHFHDPLTNQGLLGSYSALVWATLPSENQHLEDFSWHDVRNVYYQALTARQETTRNQYFALTFRGIGQVMHLVQVIREASHETK